MNVKKRLIAEYVTKGYTVIRADKTGCPDFIFVPDHLANQVKAIKVSDGPPTKVQSDTISRLQNYGISASVYYVSKEDKAPTGRHTPEEWQELGQEWFNQGYQAFFSGLEIKDFPKHDCSRWSALYQRRRAEWQQGWSQGARDQMKDNAS